MTPAEIKAARMKLMLSNVGLAEALGVSRSAVVLWEGGHRTMPPPAVKLLKIFLKYPGLLSEEI